MVGFQFDVESYVQVIASVIENSRVGTFQKFCADTQAFVAILKCSTFNLEIITQALYITLIGSANDNAINTRHEMWNKTFIFFNQNIFGFLLKTLPG